MSLSNREGKGASLKSCFTLAMLTVAQIVFSGLATYWLSHTYGLGRRIILLHVVIVSVLFATITLMLGWSLTLRAVRESSLARRLFLLIPGAASGFLAFLYVGDYIGNFWGRNLNYVLVFAHVEAFMRGAGIVPISTPVFLVLSGYLGVFILGYQVVARRYWTGIELLYFTSSQLSVLGRVARRGVYVVGLSWVAIFGYLSSVWNSPTGYLVPQFEPVTSFFVSVFPDPPAMSNAAASSLAHQAPYIAPGHFDRRNVILITIDSARADHFQTYGYARPTSPFLTGLARDGTLRKVEMALSTCSESACGVRTTLASQPFNRVSITDLKLHELLRGVGYKSYFILSSIHDWYGLKEFYGRDNDLLFDGSQSRRHVVTDDRLLFEGLEQVPVYHGEPAFFAFHLVSAHQAGMRQEAFKIYTPADRDWLWQLLGREEDRVSYENGYDNGITQADAIISQLFEALKKKGYLERSLVVIIGDHGEAFGERGPSPHFGHINALYQEYVHIPLFIYDDPHVEYRNLKFATQLDVAPTIVERLGLPVPPSWQGRSLLRPEPDIRYTFHETTPTPQPVRMVVFRTPDATYKYMRSQETEELYEIVSDPLEQTNLVTTAQADLLADLRARLSEYERNGS